MAPTKPSLELLRSLSDEHVLRTLMSQRHATRAQIATATGLSKPTISESVRRLEAAGAVVDTGARTTGRGRVGSYYALPAVAGCALAVGIAPEGIVAEALDVYGDVVAHARADVARSPGPGQVSRTVERLAKQVADAAPGGFRVAVVSAADPVDRASGRLVELPDAPFLLGALDPRAVLGPLVSGPVVVDNDVNWAARAEMADGRTHAVTDFVYLYLGEGIGCAVVADGQVRRGHSGIAGEVAHLLTVGPDSTAMRLTDVFRALDLRRRGSTAIDVPRLLYSLDQRTTAATQLQTTLAQAVAGVLAAAVALADPAVALIGGPWGRHPGLLAQLTFELAVAPRGVPIAAAALGDGAALTGVREAALNQLRDDVIAAVPRRPGFIAQHHGS